MHTVSSVCGCFIEIVKNMRIKYWNIFCDFLLFVSFVFVCSDTAGHNPHVCIAKDRCHALNLILSKLFQKMKEKCSNLLILLYT